MLAREHANWLEAYTDYEQNQLIVRTDWLQVEVADAIHAELEAFDGWSRMDTTKATHTSGKGGIFDYVEPQNLFLVGPATSRLLRFLQGAGRLYLERVTNRKLESIMFPALYRFQPGCFLGTHSDKDSGGVVTLGLNFTKDWQSHWGGQLIMKNRAGAFRWFPNRFNNMLLFDVEAHGLEHFVSGIRPQAQENRYSLIIWMKDRTGPESCTPSENKTLLQL